MKESKSVKLLSSKNKYVKFFVIFVISDMSDMQFLERITVFIFGVIKLSVFKRLLLRLTYVRDFGISDLEIVSITESVAINFFKFGGNTVISINLVSLIVRKRISL